jgi:hypothetical protein
VTYAVGRWFRLQPVHFSWMTCRPQPQDVNVTPWYLPVQSQVDRGGSSGQHPVGSTLVTMSVPQCVLAVAAERSMSFQSKRT